MPRLLQRMGRTTRCLGQRPGRDEFAGINQDSVQAVGLAAWWPLWEPMASGHRAPQAMDYGPNGMHMTPSVNTLHAADPMMGCCWLGNMTPAGVTGVQSWQAHSRPYGSTKAVDPVDFGALPNTTTLARAHMSTAWVRTGEDARRFRNGAPLDSYVYSFDRSDSFGFPGHALAAIMRIPNGGTATPDAAASLFDNDATGSVPFGVQSLQVINDDRWHLLCGLYIPIGFTAGSAYGTGLQYIMVDGEVGFIGGLDDQSTNVAQPFGFSASQVNLGSPQDAGHAANPAPRQFIGSDDDGVSSPWIGYQADHRLYHYDWKPGGTYLDVVQLALQQARAMYHPETRWELYYPPPARKSFVVNSPAGGGTTFGAGGAGAFAVAAGTGFARVAEPGAAGGFTVTAGAGFARTRGPGGAGSYTLTAGAGVGHQALTAAGGPGAFTLAAGAGFATLREPGSAGTFALTAGTGLSVRRAPGSAGAYTVTAGTGFARELAPGSAGSYTLTPGAASARGRAAGTAGAYTLAAGTAFAREYAPGSAGAYTLAAGSGDGQVNQPGAGGTGVFTLTAGAGFGRWEEPGAAGAYAVAAGAGFPARRAPGAAGAYALAAGSGDGSQSGGAAGPPDVPAFDLDDLVWPVGSGTFTEGFHLDGFTFPAVGGGAAEDVYVLPPGGWTAFRIVAGTWTELRLDAGAWGRFRLPGGTWTDD